MSQHTPGPWRVGDAGQTVFGPPNGKPSPEMVAQRIRSRANARLIAAAPEMYEFIQRIESGEPFGIASPATAARALLAKIDGAA